MGIWITGKDIVKDGLLNEATLIIEFGSGALSGYILSDNSEVQLINLEHERQIFANIQMLCAPKIGTEHRTVKNPNYRNPYTNRTWDRPPEQPTCTIVVDVERYRFSRGVGREWLPWKKLLQILSNAGHEDRWPVVEIPPIQLNAIEAGWNADRVRDLAFSAYFKEEDVMERSPKQSPQQSIPNGTYSDVKHHQTESKRAQLKSWKDIERVAGMNRKTITKAEKSTSGKAVVHHEGNAVWAYEDEIVELVRKYGLRKERDVAEKKKSR
jgi:hypothetical protein